MRLVPCWDWVRRGPIGRKVGTLSGSPSIARDWRVQLVTMLRRSGVTVIAATASQQDAGATANDLTIPPGYRHWRLISVAILGTPFNDIRAKLGNDLAISAVREAKIPFPDGL